MGEERGLGQDSLRRAVLAGGIEAEPVWFEEVGSTNTEALRLAEEGAPAWTVVATGHQTAGRGRLGRTWSDVPGGSLLATVLIRPELAASHAPLLTLAAAVSMIDAIALPGLRSKWPNDLVVGGRKIGGILAEASIADGRLRHVVIGTGVNLSASGLPGDRTSSSVADEGGDADGPGILQRYLAALRRISDAPPDGLIGRYVAVCSTIGRRVRATPAGGDPVEGLATGLDDRGSLLIEAADGVRAVGFGEVVHLRTP